MTDQNLPYNFLVSISKYVYKNTVNKSLLLLFFLLLSCKLLNQKKRELTIAFITPSWVAIALLTDPLLSLQSPSGSRANLKEYFILHRSLIRLGKGSNSTEKQAVTCQ